MSSFTLANAYIQLIPSLKGFENDLASQMGKNSKAIKAAGARAGTDWSQGFLSTAKETAVATTVTTQNAAAARASAVAGAKSGSEWARGFQSTSSNVSITGPGFDPFDIKGRRAAFQGSAAARKYAEEKTRMDLGSVSFAEIERTRERLIREFDAPLILSGAISGLAPAARSAGVGAGVEWSKGFQTALAANPIDPFDIKGRRAAFQGSAAARKYAEEKTRMDLGSVSFAEIERTRERLIREFDAPLILSGAISGLAPVAKAVIPSAIDDAVRPELVTTGSKAGRAYAESIMSAAAGGAGLSPDQLIRDKNRIAAKFDTAIGNMLMAMNPAMAMNALFGAMNPAIDLSAQQAAQSWAQKFITTLSAADGVKLSQAGSFLTRAVTLPIAAIGGLSVKAAVDFESAFAGVRKTVDATEAEFASLREGLIGMSNAMPITREELSRIAELGGQFDIDAGDLLKFTDVVAKLGVATNITTDDAATFIARFAKITGLPTADFDRLGAAVTELGNNAAATESEITTMALRLAGAGNFIGLTEAEILGISAALAELGLPAEAGGTAFSRVFKKIDDATRKGGQGLQDFASTAGMTASEFAQTWETNTAGAVAAVVDGIATILSSGGDAQAQLDKLGLSDIRISDATLRAAGNFGGVAEQIERSNQAFEANTALDEEAAKRFATLASQLRTFANNVGAIGLQIGEALTPAIKVALDFGLAVARGITPLVEGFAKLPTFITGPIIAFAGLAAAVGPATSALGFFKTGMQSIVESIPGASGAITGLLGKFNATAAGFLKGSALITVAAVGFSTAIAENSRQARDNLQQMLMPGTQSADFLNAEKTAKQAVAVEALARSLAKVDEVGTLSATDSILNFFGLYSDNGNRGRKAEEDINSAVEAIKSSKAPAADATAAVDLLEERLRSYGLSSEEVTAQVKPLRDAIAEKAATEENAADVTKRAERANRLAEQSATDFASQLLRMNEQSDLSKLGAQAAAAAVAAFSAEMDRAGMMAKTLSAALTSGQAFRDLRIGFGLEKDPAKVKSERRKVANETERVANEKKKAAKSTDGFNEALKRLDPRMSDTSIRLQSLKSGADAFRESIENSSGLDNILGSALAVGDAFRDFSRGAIRRLPKEIDVLGLSVGKYTKRQREAISTTLAAGKAGADYLATLIETGATSSRVRSEADRLRAAFVEQFRAAGFTTAQINTYLSAMGLLPSQVETALKVSGLQSAKQRIELFANLLTGRIPPEVASQVIAAIDADQLDRAADILADFAKTAPKLIEIDTKVDTTEVKSATGDIEDLEAVTMKIPDAFDVVKFALGGYSIEEEAGLKGLITAADSVKAVVASIVEAGDPERARQVFESLRQGLIEFLQDPKLNVAPDKINEIVDSILGLDGKTVDVAIEVAGFEKAKFELEFLREILTREGGKGIPQVLDDVISSAVANGDFTTAASLLKAFVDDMKDYVIENPILIALGIEGGYSPEEAIELTFDADITQAQAIVQDLRERTEANGGVLPVDADTQAAVAQLAVIVDRVNSADADVPIDGKIGAAVGVVNDFIAKYIDPTRTIEVDANTDQAVAAFKNFEDYLRRSPFINQFLPNGFPQPLFSGPTPYNPPPLPQYPRNHGGIIPGRGPDRDSVHAMLTPGEFVIRRRAVDKYGVEFLKAINAGQFNSGGLVVKSKDRAQVAASRTPIVARVDMPAGPAPTTDGGVSIENVQIVSPNPRLSGRDLLRSIANERFLRGGVS